MAAINKNFVVKNGIEVGDNLIFGNKDQLRVGIGTTVPNYTLDVRGGIGATSVSVGQTLTANSGIITTLTASNVTITTLNATGVAATAIQSTWFQVGSGLTFTTGIATNFTVSGIATFGSNIGVTGVTTSKDLKVVGIATIETLDVQTKLDVYDSEAVFHNNVRIDGNLSIGGTTTTIVASDLRVTDRDIVLGVTTNSFGADISNDTTANHGGIAIASTEGSPLVDLVLTGFSTLPSTYKQMMWVKADSYGFGTTDAFLFNYAVGIGSTLVPNGVRLAVSNIHFTDDTITSRNVNVTNGLNVSGALTATSSNSTWSQVGSGLTFTTGIGTNLNISGITTTNSLYIDATEVISSARQLQNIASLDATTTATIETAIANAPNTFTDLTVTGIATFNNNVGVAGIITATAIQFTWSQVGLGLTFTSGIGTNLIISGIASVGSGITLTSSGNANFTGIVTAQSFRGDGSQLTGTISGVGIKSDGVTIGTGITTLNFTGGSVQSVTGDPSAGISTITIQAGPATPAGSNTQIQYNNAGVTGASTNFTFDGSNVYIAGICTALDFNSLSDIKHKTNINTVNNALLKVEQMRGVKFNWKESGNPSYGVIAQELQEVLPELVHGDGPKTVNYNGIIGVLIEAIKELKEEVNKLKKDKR
jgi:hypothetical protein